MVFPYNDGLIHSLPLRENHLNLTIDNIEERYKDILVPVITNEIGILKDVVGTVIQWSWITIVLSKRQPPSSEALQQPPSPHHPSSHRNLLATMNPETAEAYHHACFSVNCGRRVSFCRMPFLLTVTEAN
ncbi:unnamed protein product [Lactuca saligna]|uniref:DUF8039 domain-containing protein n=1 Tax=Lactuca saligna TaxID=75948 RepID=A0AA35ZNM3_LACSI|nr:unnamed protein product [Lactuca saligna]